MAGQAIEVPIQKTLFDLDTFSEVTLVKTGSFSPVSNVQEAMARVSGDTEKFLGIVNEGLRAEYQRDLRADPSGWHSLDDEGEVNGEFKGTIADIKAVNALILTLAKTVFGYSKDLDAKGKAAAKESAMEMIKSTEKIREGLKKSAALTASAE